MDPVVKFKAIIDADYEEYTLAYSASFGQDNAPEIDAFTGWLIDFLKNPWRIDFTPYTIDSVTSDDAKGRKLLELLLETYADEIEDVQAEIGTSLRHIVKFLKKFSPKLDFMNEISPDCYARRPLERLWQMEPVAIFEGMTVSEDAEADALLDTIERNFTPVVPDVASTVDAIRRGWFSWYKPDDEHDASIFYEIIERAITHAVATEGRLAATDWIFRNLDSNALLVGILEICREGLECLTMFCGNYKFYSEHRKFIEKLAGGKG